MATLVKNTVDSLELGRILAHPIYSPGGVLLLSAGNEITTEHVQSLKARGISTVIMDSSDTSGFSAGGSAGGPADQRGPDDLKELLSGAGYSICNNGPPVWNSIARHGCKSYDQGFRKKLVAQQRESRDACRYMFEDLSSSRDVNGNNLRDISGSQLAMLTEDLESTLALAFDGNRGASIVEDSVNTAVLGMAIGIEMGMDFSNVNMIGTAGCLVNVGMMNTPDIVREERSTLSLNARLELQKVPGRSLDLLEKVTDIPSIVRLVVYQAHERMDGSGFPRGLEGNKIHVFARTLQVATEYQRLQKGNSHSPGLSPYQAMESLIQMAHHRQLDAEIVRRMLYLVSLYPIGSHVRLSDGSTASVIRANGKEFTKPVVKREFDACGRAVQDDDDAHLIDLLHSELSVMQTVANIETDAA